jgi:hypothetical protein
LPEDVELVQVQQMGELARQVGSEALSFLSAWSLIVYAAIAVASHAIASRLVVESGYELAMLRALGAKRSDVLVLVLAYTAMIALASSVLGIAIGTAGGPSGLEGPQVDQAGHRHGALPGGRAGPPDTAPSARLFDLGMRVPSPKGHASEIRRTTIVRSWTRVTLFR